MIPFLFLWIFVTSFADLISVSLICRHGDRGPRTTVPTWDLPTPEQLTPLGMQQQVDVGEFLRKRYVDDLRLFPTEYSSKDIYVRASNYNRTIMSASSQLAGLYPKGAGPNNLYNYPVLTELKHDDFVARSFQICPTGIDIWEKTKVSQKYLDAMSKYDEQLKKASKLLNVDVNYDTLEKYQNAMECRKQYGGLDPAQEESFQELSHALHTQELFYYPNDNKEWLKVTDGVLFYELFYDNPAQDGMVTANLQEKIALNKKKYRLYSMHDSTVFATLRSLNYSIPSHPYYAAVVIFEFHASGEYPNYKNPYVKFYYQPDEQSARNGDLWVPFTPRGCVKSPVDGDGCTLDSIQKEFSGDTFPISQREKYLTEVCGRKDVDRYAPAPRTTTKGGPKMLHLILIAVLGILLAVSVVLIFTRCQKIFKDRKANKEYFPINN
ncbi:putative Intestinal acid phosphatase [Blattamonas nauphoetae]|uniref:Intestinal acid phosphatase n=1 Tax=Blattamonas nauphoetae TaxID=2049346 RepID=A0ABQ9XJA8_9EUKA|nr:putative Intestinal acid phosphatase [Blattamonas nauphoetae]